MQTIFIDRPLLTSVETASETALSLEKTGLRMPLRIGLLMDHPSPHMIALLEAVAARTDCTLEVVYCGKSAPGRHWGNAVARVPHGFVKGFTGPQGIRFNPGLLRAMSRLHVDIWVLNTIYGSLTTLMAAWWLRLHSKSWVFMNEPVRPRPKPYAWLKERPLAFVLDKANGIIGTGKAAVEMYRQRFRKNCPCESVPYFIDLSLFSNLPDPTAPADGEDLQFVTSCQLIKRKGIDSLLQACKYLPETGWHLTIIGDGPLRSKLESQFDPHIRGGRVTFLGPIPYPNRARAFASRHVLVFPSYWDGWGMVLPEALAAGLPAISTDRVVSAHEFIEDGKNGFIVQAGDSWAIADKMQWFIQNPDSYPRMSHAARRSLRNYRPDSGAEVLVRYLRNVSAEAIKEGRVRSRPLSPEQSTWTRLTNPPKLTLKTMRWMHRLGKSAMIRGSLASSARRRPRGDLVLAYHLVLKEDKRNFENQVKFFSDHFRISSLRKTLRADRSSHQDEFRLAITFDDGFRLLMHDCLEVLEKHGIKATFFVPTAFVNSAFRSDEAAAFSTRAFYYNHPLEPMNPEDLRQLVLLGHEIGSHGVFHAGIHSMTPESARRELAASRSMICKWTGVAPEVFSYPYGESRNAHGNPADWLREAGFAYALTLTRGCVSQETNRFAVPRHHVEGNWSISELRYFLLS